MPIELLTADAFRVAAKDGAQPDCRLLRSMPGEPEQDLSNPNTFRFTCSDESEDLVSDVIKQSGWMNLPEFEEKNGVGLWAHDSSEPPIGRWKNIAVIAGKLKGDLEFIPEEIYPFAGMLAKMVKGGFLNAVSVGFAPVEWEYSKDKKRPNGMNFLKQKLLEISLCPVPCNQNAIIDARSAGIDTGPLSEWAEKILDGQGRISLQKSFVEELFRQAKTPRTTRQKYLAKSEAADWKVGAQLDLPVFVAANWDGPDAAKRMLDDAGFDGDNPDAEKAARGFLLHDAANPMLRASYKLPFADIIDGELKAVHLGIIAAKDAATKEKTNKSDAPAILDDALAVITGYQTKATTSIVSISPGEETTISPTEKSGRRISNANTALLQKAMEHHDSATQCLKDVLASNTPDDDPEDDAPDDQVPPVTVVTLDARAQRLKEAADLKALLKI
jgi:HK97 family phage prohead protease